ncbi:hypothetical protein B0J11DRAFT_606285 [Dendryphion nanum]|uniref:WW domain-containing protein n=1 Tax=Dendryphion nanum TaxID=256645 RepID=A0A9P9IMF7_9PLEO|nr:hypothetical protein B0J11DRAFT_606285 [Dendryphion nanum]
MNEMERSGAPLLNHRALFVDESKSTMYAFAGEKSWEDMRPGIPQPPTPWKFVADGQGGGTWMKMDGRESNYDATGIIQPASGSSTYGNGVGYYLGGHLNGHTWPSLQSGVWRSVSGLITFNMTTGVWSNTSAQGYGTDQIAHFGFAQFVPSFGSKGLVVFMGGQDQSERVSAAADLPRQFGRVTFLDVSSGNWYHQKVGGWIPSWRNRACAVGAQGDNNTYEIFVYAGCKTALYGGPSPTEEQKQDNNDSDEIFVLSLPSFQWFKADYVAKASRQGHTCHIIGNRQLLTIGGIDPALQEGIATSDQQGKDPWPFGLGIFDMTDMRWKSQYDANASSYKSPQVVRDYYDNNSRYPTQWSSPELAVMFGQTSKPPSQTSSLGPDQTKNPVPEGPKSNTDKKNVPLIAGIATTGAIVLILVAFVVRWVYTRRPKEAEMEPVDDMVKLSELDCIAEYAELPEAPRLELPCTQRLPVITISAATPRTRARSL